MKDEDVLDISPKELHEVLKQHTIDILSDVIKLVKKEKYGSVEKYVAFSGAGNGLGKSNHYIEFYYGDIIETIERLKYLKSTSEGKS